MDYNNITEKWNSTNIVVWYKTRNHIQGGEKKIIEILQKILPEFNSMLDIGVGGGRTTLHFSNLFKNYLGIDIADKYLTHLMNKYPSCKFHIENFLYYNTKNKYNFILFSHNGIDYMSNIKDFWKVVHKMYNMCLKDGFISFSSHNTLYKTKENYSYKIRHVTVRNTSNIPQIETNPYYVLKNLKKLGFSKIIIIDKEGSEIDLETFDKDWKDNRYAWLYFMCKK